MARKGLPLKRGRSPIESVTQVLHSKEKRAFGGFFSRQVTLSNFCQILDVVLLTFRRFGNGQIFSRKNKIRVKRGVGSGEAGFRCLCVSDLGQEMSQKAVPMSRGGMCITHRSQVVLLWWSPSPEQ